MNTNLKRFFSLSAIDHEYLNDNQNKFELVKCPGEGMKCKEQLLVINKIYVDSEFFRREKDFKNSIETLKNAFYITTELSEKPCTKCAEVFRATVIDSLENIHSELKTTTSGIFGNKKYQSSLIFAENVLSELKSFNLHDKFQRNCSSCERFIENNPKRKVS
jgi:hypothetical protein